MATFLVTNPVHVQRYAIALHDMQVGSTTMNAVLEDARIVGGLDKAINTYFSAAYGSMAPSAVAAIMVANLGLTGDAATVATAYIAGELASVDAAVRGAKVLSMVNHFSGLTADATFGAAATAYNATVSNAVAYAETNTADVAAGTGVTGTFTLTTAADTVAGTSGDDMIIATDSTLSSADRIEGGNGSDELKVSAQNTTKYSAFEMNGVETVTVTADNDSTQTFDLSGANGVTLLKTLNSTGTVAFNEVTSIANLEVNNFTDGADFSVRYQDTSATTDTVALAMVNNRNANTNVITVGSETAGDNAGIETINVSVSGANTTIGRLDSNISTLGVTGDRNLTITTALNSTVDTVAAGSFTGGLNISLVGNIAAPAVGTTPAEGALSVTTGTGADTVNMAGVARNAVVTMGDGNDTLTMGMGRDTVSMGAGNDRINIAADGLTVLDTISGGAGVDTIVLTQADTITKSEAEQVSDVEVFTLTTAGSELQVSDRMVTSITGANTFTVNMGVAGNVVDITNVTFSNTNMVAINGTTGSDRVLADDATVNAKATIAFGQDGFGTANVQAGAVDTLVVIGEGTTTLTSDDFSNITGVDQLTLTTNDNRAQTFNVTINSAMIDTRDSSDNTVGDAIDELVIYADRNLPQGSVINLDASSLTATQLITVRTNSNVTVNVISAGAGTVTQVSSLEFTENADNLTSAVNSTYTADSLDQLDTADFVNAAGVADTLRLDFSVNNAAADLDTMFNNFSDNTGTLEAVRFNTNNNVSFRNITTTATLSGVTSVTTLDGNDTVAGNTAAATFNLGNGNNSYTAAAVVAETVITGTGTDTFNFTTAQLTGTDRITAGTGRDVLNLTDGAGAVAAYALMTAALSGVDTVNYTATNVADGLSVNNAALAQSEAGLIVNVTDSSLVNTKAIFNAGTVTAGNSVVVNVAGAGAGQALNAADVIGGAGNDTITIGGTVTGYVVQANAGADTINLTTANAVSVLFNSPNDGSASGSVAVYDTITGFTSGTDVILFNNVTFAAADKIGTGAAAGLANVANDAPANFTAAGASNVLVMTQAGSGFLNADLLDLSVIAARANTIGITAGATDGGIFVAQGQTQSAIYLYVEADGTANNVTAGEIKLLGTVDTNALVATDLAFA